MRLDNPLDGLLFNRTSTRVLRALCAHPTRKLTSNEVAKAAGAPTHRVLEVLRAFEGEGVVTSQVVGTAYWWSVRRGHPLTKAAERLFEEERRATERMTDRIRKALGGTPGVERVVIFGSAARREQKAGSDLDLLVVVASAGDRAGVERVLQTLRAELGDRYGTSLRPLVYTRREFTSRRGTPLLKSIQDEGKVLHSKEE